MAHGSTRTGKTTTATVATAEKQRDALKLRKLGIGYDEIAARVGYSDRGAAYKAVRVAIAEITKEVAAEVKALEIERCEDRYADAIATRTLAAETGDLETRIRANLAADRIAERRSKLEGLDAPVKTQEVAPETMSEEQLRKALLEELEASKARSGK